MIRRLLPQRRNHEVSEFSVDSIRYTVGIGRYADGLPAEVFYELHQGRNRGGHEARDAAILLSFLLQHGAKIDGVAHALTRKTDGTPLGPIGRVAMMLSVEIKEVGQ